MKIFTNKMPYILLSPLYIIVGVFIYWWTISYTQPVVVKLLEHRPDVTSVGGTISYKVEFDASRTCNYHITRYLNNSENIRLDSFQLTLPKGKQIYDIKAEVPKTTKDGFYTFHVVAVFICNPFDYLFPGTMTTAVRFPIEVNNTPLDSVSLIPVSTKLKVGEPLEFSITFTRRRMCNTTLNRFITDKSNNKVIVVRSRPGSGAGAGTFTVKEQFELNIPPGKYHFRSKAVDQCFDDTYPLEQAEFDFEVEE